MHEFARSDENLGLIVEEASIPIHISLNWYNSSEVHNFDLVLLKDGKPIKTTNKVQRTQLDEKIEELHHIPKFTGTYQIQIKHVGEEKPDNVMLEIFSEGGKLDMPKRDGSIVVPKDAKGAIVVGAINSSGHIREYSSQGPTNAGNPIQNLMAVDGISTNICILLLVRQLQHLK